ncbi:MAG: diphthine synthase [Candidatus Aenigmatarchaeota archaeon]
MLVLAGLGLGNENSITIEELEEAKKADKVYIEEYTNIWLGKLENLEKMIGKKIIKLNRKDLEEESYKIVEEAKNKNIIIFVPGDPLIATTHLSLVLDCLKKRVEYKILHNSSIVSAVGETGLHIYKFGRIVTIPLKEKIRTSYYIRNVIEENRRNGLHTLCLLDLDVEKNVFLTVNEALRFLLEEKILDRKERIIIASLLGTHNSRIVYNEIEKLMNINLELPSIIIIPGELHFTEKEYLDLISTFTS